VEAIIDPIAREKGLAFRVTPDDPGLTVWTDAGKVRQILLQLLTNAVKFTPGGEIELGATREGDWLVYSVRDTGLGIPREHQTKIFEPFWQVEQTITRTAEGTGMGLTVSERLAKLMGGEIRLQSTPGEGTTFFLRLPFQGKP
jgi:two-component system phosphate regulon sensor histidine kinase PhoR